MRHVFAPFFWPFVAAGFADDAAKPKFTMTGELDLGVTYDSVAGTTTDKPTELKLSPTLSDGNVGFNSRIFFSAAVLHPSSAAPPLSALDYAYGTYLLYWFAFRPFHDGQGIHGRFCRPD